MERRTGFSLVELLVVIAIILTLLALLLPLTLRLEDGVNLMIDINNFHKIYEAMYAYAQDHKGHLPHKQAAKELCYYSCSDAWKYWAPKLGYDPSSTDEETKAAKAKYVCDNNDPAYLVVIDAYKEYVPEGSMSVFFCRSPKQSQTGKTNYCFRVCNECGCRGIYHIDPPGGWVIGVHNPRAHIITEYNKYEITNYYSNEGGYHQVLEEGEKKEPGPFDLVYNNGNDWIAWFHMGNKVPVCRLDGSAEVITYRREWPSLREGFWFMGNWFPGQGGI